MKTETPTDFIKRISKDNLELKDIVDLAKEYATTERVPRREKYIDSARVERNLLSESFGKGFQAEKRLAKWMLKMWRKGDTSSIKPMHKHFKAIDYEMPLKAPGASELSSGWGKVDILAANIETKELIIIELKLNENSYTPLQTIAEAILYSAVVVNNIDTIGKELCIWNSCQINANLQAYILAPKSWYDNRSKEWKQLGKNIQKIELSPNSTVSVSLWETPDHKTDLEKLRKAEESWGKKVIDGDFHKRCS